jgi:hypothetical protein
MTRRPFLEATMRDELKSPSSMSMFNDSDGFWRTGNRRDAEAMGTKLSVVASCL